MADTNRTSLFLLEESTFGTTPASAAWTTLRPTGESLQFGITNTSSDEIRSDRNIQDLVQTDATVSGDVNFELSHGSFDTLLEGAMCSAFSANVLKNGTTAKSYTLEKKFADAGRFHTYKGCRIGGFNLNVASGSIVTGSFSVQGKNSIAGASSASSGTPNASSSTTPFNAVGNVGTLKEGGSTLSDNVTAISLSVSNNLRSNQAIGTLGSTGIGLGSFEVTGTMSVYFANDTLYNKYLQSTESSLEFTMTDASSNAITILLPRIKYSSGTVLAGGGNADVMVELGFQAIYNASDTATIKITRT